MSSTNRGAVRSPNDFYRTDPDELVRFFNNWKLPFFGNFSAKILDPSAGGLTEEVVVPPNEKKIKEHLASKSIDYPYSEDYKKWIRDNGLVFPPSTMSYPEAIKEVYGDLHTVDTIDIRENSRAAVKANFLTMPDATLIDQGYDMVITNPPFSLAIEFIEKSMRIVKPGGFVVMLLRLNFFGSDERNDFFLSGNMPDAAYVHAKRLGFTPDGKTDSIEYMHAIWVNDGQKRYQTMTRVLPY